MLHIKTENGIAEVKVNGSLPEIINEWAEVTGGLIKKAAQKEDMKPALVAAIFIASIFEKLENGNEPQETNITSIEELMGRSAARGGKPNEN